MNRLFISLDLPNEIIDQLIKIRQSIWDVNNLKWEPSKKLHLTLKFIGDVNTEIKDLISNELTFLKTHSEIFCTINKFDFFYRDGNPIILWAGLDTDNSLLTLTDEINVRLQKFSISAVSNMFKPHITILRMKNDLGLDFVNSFKNFSFKPIHFTANTITFYRSELTQYGSKYIAIKNYKLKELEK